MSDGIAPIHDAIRMIRNVDVNWIDEAVKAGYIVEEAPVDPRRLGWKNYCREAGQPEIIVRPPEGGKYSVVLWFRGTLLSMTEILPAIKEKKNWTCPEDGVFFYDIPSLEEAEELASELADAFFA